MSYADDFEDAGAYFARQEAMIRECDRLEGDCNRCRYWIACGMESEEEDNYGS